MNSRILRSLILVADLLWLNAALFIAHQAHFGAFAGWVKIQSEIPDYFGILGLVLTVWFILYFWLSLDGFRGGWNFPAVFSQVVSGVFVLMVLVLAGAYLGKDFFSRLVMFHYSYLLVVGFVAIRYVARRTCQSRYFAKSVKRTVILGNGSVAQELAAKLRKHPEMMCEVVGFLCRQVGDGPSLGFGASTFSIATPLRSPGILEFLRHNRIDELIVVLPDADSEIMTLINQCRASGIRVSLVPMLYELYVSQPEFVEVDGLPVVSLQNLKISKWMIWIKRCCDIALGAIFLTISLPLFGAAALWLKKARGMPIFRRESRSGRYGRSFEMLRLNIDRNRSVKRSGFEKMLLKFSVTELPQLWNVLRGEMSMVGPRPESPERVKHYSEWQKQRLMLNPGLTGLAQVHGLREQHSSEKKTHFDLQYIVQWTPILDLSLILQTLWTLANRPTDRSISLQEVTRLEPFTPATILIMPIPLPEEVMNADRP